MSGQRPIGVLTGLAFEAKLAKSLARHADDASVAPLVACAAASRERATREAEALCRQGAIALLSFGIAGGLDPALPISTIILAQEIRAATGETFPCDSAWQARVMAKAAGLSLASAPLAAADQPLIAAADKAALFATTGAAAVDMESLAAAQVAATAGIPFLALRAIADPADCGLPTAALAPLSTDGKPQPFQVMGRLATRPWELPALLQLGVAARRAERALAGLAGIATPLFGGF